MNELIEIVVADGAAEEEALRRRLAAAEETDREVSARVAEILENVRRRGDDALFEYCEKFDSVRPETLEVSREELCAAAERCEPELRAAMERAAANIRDYHARQVRHGTAEVRPDGSVLGRRVLPLKRVGVYVPGGTAAYPSSVLMNVIPAKIAGVPEVVMVTPPSPSGVRPDIAAAALIAGADRVFRVGGAQAVAALAYGTASVPRADKIVGPGNIYVAAAKRLVYGQTDIDMIAGPSEILIWADETADPRFVAADLLSQAEHDPLAGCFLISESADLARAVAEELAVRLQTLPRADIARRALESRGLILYCPCPERAAELADRIAPEHLEILAANPMERLGRIRNAGSVFLGPWSPEPLGDYYAGPNHVLPTAGTARFFSPLSVDSFVKTSSYIYYSREAFENAAADVIRVAEAEGLSAHAEAVRVRTESKVSS